MVTPLTGPERLRALCAASRGFVYAVTMTGTTGRNVAVPDEVLGYLDRVRASSPIDRKSTRLNSSHLVISYAVFCLKKKKRLHTSHLAISYAGFCLKKNSYQDVTT